MSDDDRDDLGARVLAARGRSVVDPPPDAGARMGRLTWGTVAILVVGAVVLLVALRRTSDLGPSGGGISATERTELELGHRGVAVLEPGATIDWSIDAGGALRVGHHGGAVFYRVQRGGSFTVSGSFGRLEAGRASFTVRAAAPASVTVHQGQISYVCGDRVAALEAGPPRPLAPCAGAE